MAHEALVASEALSARGVNLRVIAMPWLNRFDVDWLGEEVAPHDDVFVLEDHSPVGGLADSLRRALDSSTRVTAFGVEGWPVCGRRQRRSRLTARRCLSRRTDRARARLSRRS